MIGLEKIALRDAIIRGAGLGLAVGGLEAVDRHYGTSLNPLGENFRKKFKKTLKKKTLKKKTLKKRYQKKDLKKTAGSMFTMNGEDMPGHYAIEGKYGNNLYDKDTPSGMAGKKYINAALKMKYEEPNKMTRKSAESFLKKRRTHAQNMLNSNSDSLDKVTRKELERASAYSPRLIDKNIINFR